VANEEEAVKYKSAIPENMYFKIVVGELGITNQRNFITRYFPEGTEICSIDDDITDVLELRGFAELRKDGYHSPTERLALKSRALGPILAPINISQFIFRAFSEMREKGLGLWGVYPCMNSLFMKVKPPITTSLTFCIGCIHGYINDKTLILSPTIETKEDYERTFLYYKKYGGVLRYNHICVRTKFQAVGGVGNDRVEISKISAERLQAKYPEYVSSVFIRKSNGNSEVRLKKLKSG
jgi:hypothetical protein